LPIRCLKNDLGKKSRRIARQLRELPPTPVVLERTDGHEWTLPLAEAGVPDGTVPT
jgi:hypothetical protein